MNLSLLDTVLWAAGFLLNAALLFILFYKGRYRIVPWFTAWIGFEILYTIMLFVAFRFGSKHTYALLYWTDAFGDILLQLFVILEIARYVFRRSGRWVEGVGRLGVYAASAPFIAGLLAWRMTPAATSVLDAWDSRASLFTTVLVIILFTAIMLVSQQVGVGWRSIVLSEGYGFLILVVVAFFTDTLHAYWRTAEHFTELEHIRILAYLGALLYWSVVFWLPEREMEPISMSTNKRLEALRREIELRQVE